MAEDLKSGLPMVRAGIKLKASGLQGSIKISGKLPTYTPPPPLPQLTLTLNSHFRQNKGGEFPKNLN